jgi:hypothetical protein
LREKHRKVKVLHIGNIANYAYNVAKVLQTEEIESHVIAWDYYHINAQPIWEEGDFDASQVGDHYFPRLPNPREADFELPRWYWHGPRRLAVLGLIANNEGQLCRAAALRFLIKRYLRRIADSSYREEDAKTGRTRIKEALATILVTGSVPPHWLILIDQWLRAKAWGWLFTPMAGSAIARAKRKAATPPKLEVVEARAFEERTESLLAQYRADWPDRVIDPALLKQFGVDLSLMQRLFGHYDVIIGYAIDGIWPLMAGKPMLAYEFGTIRNLPFENGFMGQLASVVYRNSALTIVTNCDNEAPAKRLGRPYRFLPHVINEGGRIDHAHEIRQELVSKYGGSFYVYHPPRQHWDETRNTNWDKGNDKLFRGFARLINKHGIDARCIAVNWGDTLVESKALVNDLGIADKVIWVDPLPHRRMMRMIAAVDAVADQFTIPTFGGIPPKAFYAGRPVVTCFNPELHRWCFGNLPPLLSASTPDEIEKALVKLAKEPTFAKDLANRAERWYHDENSNAHIRKILCDIIWNTHTKC